MPITMNIFNRQTYPTTNFSLVTKKEIEDGKSTLRATNCNTPFRMPLNQHRKSLPCPKPGEVCGENTKVLKDNHALQCCYNPYISSAQNPGGRISNKFVFSHQHLLHKKNKLYKQNVPSNFQSAIPLSDSSNNYLVSFPDPSNNKIMYQRCATFKKGNRNHSTYGAVSQRQRINRLKYNAVTARVVANYGATCNNRNRNCYDSNDPRFRVDISKPAPCKPYTSRENKRLICRPDYTGDIETEPPTPTYVFPKFEPLTIPPPAFGLESNWYHKNLYNFDINFKWRPLEFNTNPNAKNPYANFGPVPTTNTTTNSDAKTYTEFVTDTSIIYIETTPTVTTIRTVDKATYKVTVKSYSKGSIIPDIQGIQTNSVERDGVNVLAADWSTTTFLPNTTTTYNPPTTTTTTTTTTTPDTDTDSYSGGGGGGY
jgi:hypothetical protein